MEVIQGSLGLHYVTGGVTHVSHLFSDQVGIPELYHFVYKSKSTAQYTSPELEAPYVERDEQERCVVLYQLVPAFFFNRLISNVNVPLQILLTE